MNGRFYGDWWQMMPKEIRTQIHINDQPTVEIDVKGLHVAMLSKEQGVPLTDDPYSLVEAPFPLEVEDQRAAMKQLILTAINAKNAKEAFATFRNGFAVDDVEIHLTNMQLQEAVDLFTDVHPHLKPSLFTDQGIRLMAKDSHVAQAVIARMMHDRIPVLCIHDSFIVDARYQDCLQEKMDDVTSQLLGAPFKTELTVGRHCYNPYYDGEKPQPAQLIPAAGYLARLDLWKAKQRKLEESKGEELDYG